MAAQSLQISSSLRPAFQSAFQAASDAPYNRICPHATLRSIGTQKLQKAWLCSCQARSVVGASSTSFFGQHCKPRDPQESKLLRRGKRVVSMVTTESKSMEVGSRAPDFQLLEPLTGKTVSLDDFDGAPALLVIFMCNHCPYVIHLKKAVKELTDEYIRKGLSVVAISSNSVKTHPQDGPDQMADDAKQLGYDFPYLYDETQDVAKAYKAVCTPEFYVFKKDGRRPFELTYHGRFDETRPRSGMTPTGKDLRNALDCTLSGRQVTGQQLPSIGCSIKWHPEE
ncbi:hypothetical protein KFL_003000150 [Klebsormidium nitens]|uniref:Thioredoxin domain-containing protein n=1 Tax=Klebsormidium nitens TaxID=105231 RepID=A0A1Y1I9I3_KLENI|nr:hypothetical protein KFL_003000150 [Klebsormidium nitens]|eukprot:GAQ86622.1 hypothetical protein KFL_003000150 [Klebsormidium nitens]